MGAGGAEAGGAAGGLGGEGFDLAQGGAEDGDEHELGEAFAGLQGMGSPEGLRFQALTRMGPV